MRCRGIKPSFFTNEQLSEIPFEGRLLFIGLWCLADKRGRLEDRPKRIKVEIFPYDDVDCDNFLGYLDRRGFIKRYSVGDDKYIQIINFEKHQHPHHTEKDSVIPCFNGEITVMAPDAHRDDPSVICNLLTDRCYLETVIPPIVPQRGRREVAPINPLVKEIFDAWNVMAKQHGLPTAKPESKAYAKNLKKALKDPDFIEHWREAIGKVHWSPHNVGQNDRGWKADMEWFLREGKVLKIIGYGKPRGKNDYGSGVDEEVPF